MGDSRKVVLVSPAAGIFAKILVIPFPICKACASRAQGGEAQREAIFAAVGEHIERKESCT